MDDKHEEIIKLKIDMASNSQTVNAISKTLDLVVKELKEIGTFIQNLRGALTLTVVMLGALGGGGLWCFEKAITSYNSMLITVTQLQMKVDNLENTNNERNK